MIHGHQSATLPIQVLGLWKQELQTENFFIGHLSSQKEVDALCHLQVAFQGCENAIRFNRTPGLMQVLTQSHRYVVPMQAQLFDGRKLMVS